MLCLVVFLNYILVGCPWFKGPGCSVKLEKVVRRFCCCRRRRCKGSLISKRREKKWKREKQLERILKEQAFLARSRYRRSTSATQRKRAKREAQRFCACPRSGFDCSYDLTSEMLSRFNYKENIKETVSKSQYVCNKCHLLLSFKVLFFWPSLLSEKTGEETEKIY